MIDSPCNGMRRAHGDFLSYMLTLVLIGFKVAYGTGISMAPMSFHQRQLEVDPSYSSYPGARVDTTAPTYQLMAKETWHTWEWQSLFPGRDELVNYFRHVAKVWHLDKDISYSSKVTALHWDASNSRWKYEINKGESSGTVCMSLSPKLFGV